MQHRCIVVAAPSAPARFLELGPAVGKRLLGVVPPPQGVSLLHAGLLSLASSVSGDPSVEVPKVPGRCAAGMAELVDAESQGVVRAGALGDHLCPMVVQLALEAGESRPGAIPRPLRSAQERPSCGGAARPGQPPRLACRRQRWHFRCRRRACLAPSGARPSVRRRRRTKLAHGSSWLAVCGGDGVHGGQSALRRLELLDRRARSPVVGRPPGEHPLVLGDLFAELAVEHPGVAARRHGGVGLAGERLGDHFGGSALVREDPAVVTATRAVFQVWVG